MAQTKGVLKLHGTSGPTGYGVVGNRAPRPPGAWHSAQGMVAAKLVDDAWLMGFGLALAEVHRACGQTTAVVEVARAAGVIGKGGLQQLKDAGLDPYDLKELAKCLK